jgi:hypothetical protein
MRLLCFALPALGLLSGCYPHSHAADHIRPVKAGSMVPQLARYGLDEGQARCVDARLLAALSPWQMRKFSRAAAASGHGTKGVEGLQQVASQIKEPKVPLELSRAAEACHVKPVETAATAPEPVGGSPPQQTATAPPSRPATWVNLGAAPTGQAIAVDAASIGQEATMRTAWFRFTNPGESRPSGNAYFLRIDCAAKTINSMALRKHDPAGAVVEQRDYGPAGEGVAPIETGTVMEIAYLALCT